MLIKKEKAIEKAMKMVLLSEKKGEKALKIGIEELSVLIATGHSFNWDETVKLLKEKIKEQVGDDNIGPFIFDYRGNITGIDEEKISEILLPENKPPYRYTGKWPDIRATNKKGKFLFYTGKEEPNKIIIFLIMDWPNGGKMLMYNEEGRKIGEI
jgi:hypothetical protein